MSRMNLKVLTLNCWALPTDYLPCKEKARRIEAITKELATGSYDVVLLQEIWEQSVFQKLIKGTCHVLKYSHYFHTGIIGSGTCIFSKYPIIETFQHQFSLNGYAHRVKHADWVGGKAVGLAQLLVEDLKINVYVTHTHAAYVDDDYRVHKVVQAYEMSQFVKHTSQNCDAVIIGGDFNFVSTSVGFNLIKENAVLLDSWENQISKAKDELGATSGLPDNSFTKQQDLDDCPDGKRIDYILYRNNAGFDMVCQECAVCLKTIPGEAFCYSDHAGVMATFQIRRNVTAMPPQRNDTKFQEQLVNAREILNKGMEMAHQTKIQHLALAALVFILTLISLCGDLPFGINYLLMVYRCLAILVIAYSVLCATIVNTTEKKTITGTLDGLKHLQK